MKQDKLICGSTDITYNRGYIALWVELAGLPSTISQCDDNLQVKSSFHVSLLCVKNITDIDTGLEQNILNLFCNFNKINEVSFIKYTGELRLVTDNERDRKSIIAMCEVSNLEKFKDFLFEKLGIYVSLYPTHVTLYTLGSNKGIGIHSHKELEEKSKLIYVPKLLEIIRNFN